MLATNKNKHTSQALAQTTGGRAEDAALSFLQGKGLRLLQRNFKTPGRGGGELDLIMRDAQDTVVFIEVRQRHSNAFGGAAASVDKKKQARLVLAAQYFLCCFSVPPPCRFDVVTLQAERICWIQGAFDAGKIS